MIYVNGEEMECQSGMTLQNLLDSRGFLAERVAVEHNGEIVPRSDYGKTAVQDGDRIEIVHFVGGG